MTDDTAACRHAPAHPRTAKAAVAVLAAASVTFALSGAASAGQVQQITSFGSNPTGIGMYLYTPSNLASQPAVLVGVHACHGKGTDVCTPGGGWVTQADKYGFLLVCPSAVSSDGCWDVHSHADLTHDGGGDASGIVSMVHYVLQTKNGDANRVYVAGHSSGGMMTNVLLGSYPDVFKAGAAFAGVAFGCYAVGAVDSLGWNSSCANGNVTETAAQWGDTVRAAYPGFAGTRPRMQLWHGTADATVYFHNFGEEIKEWTNVLGVSATPTSIENNAIQSTWIRTRYTDGAGVLQVEAIQETGQPHNLVVDQAEAIHFFGLDGTGSIADAGAHDGAADARAGADDAAGADEGGRDARAVAGDAAAAANGGGNDSGDGAAASEDGPAPVGQGAGPIDDSGRSSGSGSNGSAASNASASAGGTASSGASGAASGGTDGATTQGAGESGGASNGCSVGKPTNAGARADCGWPFWLLLVAGVSGRARRRRDRCQSSRRGGCV